MRFSLRSIGTGVLGASILLYSAAFLQGCMSCAEGMVTETVAADPPTSVLTYAVTYDDDHALAYQRMSARYRSKHSQSEFARKLKAIPQLKQMNIPMASKLDGSGPSRTVRGQVDLKDGSSVAWEGVTVLEDPATNAWRCDSLRVGGYVIE
jgi:hypothetical protein